MTLPVGLWPRVERQESGGNPNAVSPKGAWGVAQLMPGTTVDPGFGVKPFNFSAPDPVAENRRVGQDYLSAMVNRYGDVPTALVAYNWGPGNADKWVKSGRNFSALPAETQGYVKNILGGSSSMMEPMRLGPPDSGGNNVPGLLDTQNQDIAGLLEGLGRPQSTLGTSLLNLGAGIASGANQGWGAGIGRGLALAGDAQQEAKANNLRRRALAAQLMKSQNANGAGVFGTPIYGTDPNTGETVLGVIGKDGSFQRLDTNGVQITPGLQFVDQGTQVLPVDRRTGAPMAQPIPVDSAGRKRQEVQGTSQGEAEKALPIVENATRRILSTITDIEKSPALSNATGPIQSRLPTVRGETADVEAKIAQAASGVFLQMFDSLKGAGAITEAEGQKAEGALGRVSNLSQSDKGYREALKEAKYEVFELLNVARRKAGLEPVKNPFEGEVSSSPSTFASESEAEAAEQAGTLKKGQKIIINGVPGTWQ